MKGCTGARLMDRRGGFFTWFINLALRSGSAGEGVN